MYMSYCRYEGTREEMRVCLSDAQEHINEEAEYEVSAREIDQFRGMVRDFVDFLNENELLDEYGDINEAVLDSVCERMARKYDPEEDEDYD